MAKSFTITQMKELLDTHENTVINRELRIKNFKYTG